MRDLPQWKLDLVSETTQGNGCYGCPILGHRGDGPENTQLWALQRPDLVRRMQQGDCAQVNFFFFTFSILTWIYLNDMLVFSSIAQGWAGSGWTPPAGRSIRQR